MCLAMKNIKMLKIVYKQFIKTLFNSTISISLQLKVIIFS